MMKKVKVLVSPCLFPKVAVSHFPSFLLNMLLDATLVHPYYSLIFSDWFAFVMRKVYTLLVREKL